MTKTELQSALAEATQTDKRTAGVFLDTTRFIPRPASSFAKAAPNPLEAPVIIAVESL
jgi:hypothetical protein